MTGLVPARKAESCFRVQYSDGLQEVLSHEQVLRLLVPVPVPGRAQGSGTHEHEHEHEQGQEQEQEHAHGGDAAYCVTL